MSHSFQALRDRCSESWQAYMEHDFVRQLGAGTLAAESVRHYLK